LRRSFAAVGVVLALAAPALADDVEQIAKARDIIRAAGNWGLLGALDHQEAKLKEAEQALQGVDETGKAPVVGEIKDARDKIAQSKASWNVESIKGSISRSIDSAENYGTRAASAEVLENGPEGSMGFKQIEEAFTDGWLKAHLDAGVLTELKNKIAWARKKLSQDVTHGKAQKFVPRFGRTISGAENALKATQEASQDKERDTGPDYYKGSFNQSISGAEELLASDDAKSLDPAELAKLKDQVATLKTDFAKAQIEVQFNNVQHRVNWIQDVLDGKNTHAYTNNVEDAFKSGNEQLDKCPQNDSRVKPLRDRLAEQRKTFDASQAKGAHDEVVDPAIKYWTYVHDEYAKKFEGWEAETTPTSLADFLHHSPPSLGCNKTEEFMREVVKRWFDDDRVKKAVAQYPNDPKLKATLDEATGIRDKAGGRVVAFSKSIIDEAEKLPPGKDRDEFKGHFYNFKNTLNRTTEGCPGNDALIARVDALEKKWEGDKNAAEGAKAALTKQLEQSSNDVWPGMLSSFKIKKLDAPEALSSNGSWKGTYIHFAGGARGVDLNRSGWDYDGQYYFIVEKDGVPICGNLDGGLEEAIKAVETQTGIERDNECEVVGVIDGTCQVWTLFHYSNGSKSVRDRLVNAVRMRIVGLKCVTVAAACGEGTNLKKLSGYKDVSVSESGSASSTGGRRSGGVVSGFFHMIHRLISWGLCALLVLAGALALAHGASKFVPQIQEQKAKLGDYLGYAGAGFAAIGVLWFGAAIVLWVLGMCEFGSLPSVALLFGGVATGIDILRVKGKLKEETASLIQPAGILFGLGCFAAALVHFFFWDVMLL
jgi:hypothetical protein